MTILGNTGGKKSFGCIFLQTHKNREDPSPPHLIFTVPHVVFNLPIEHTIWDTLYVKTYSRNTIGLYFKQLPADKVH